MSKEGCVERTWWLAGRRSSAQLGARGEAAALGKVTTFAILCRMPRKCKLFDQE